VRCTVAVATLLVSACGRIGFDESGSDVAGWTHHKTITIDGAKVIGGPHASFPVLVELASDAELAAGARSDGFDLRFTAADGVTKLPYERESFEPTTGALVAWVAVPSLPSGTSTTLDLYYGNPGALDQQQPSAVWDAGYIGVWHLGEPGEVLADSTSNGNDAHPVNGLAVGASAHIGRGLTFDGADDYLVMNDSASLDSTAAEATFSVWINWTNPAIGHYQFVMSSSNRFVTPRNGFEWASQPAGDHYFYPWGGIEQDFNLGPNPFTAGTWQYLVVTLDYTTHKVVIAVDGVPMATTQDVTTLWTMLAQPKDWMWGGNPNFSTAGWFSGSMDEIRVSATVRSAGWLATELANQRSPSTFYAVGPEI